MDLRDQYGRHPSPADLTACSACGQAIRREHPNPCPDCRAANLASRERAMVDDDDRDSVGDGHPDPDTEPEGRKD